MVDFIISADKLKRHNDGCVYGKTRKAYTRTKPIKSGWLKINPLPREKCAIIKLSKYGYSINQLSDAFGRSTSYIHKALRTAITRGVTHFLDKRKLPAQTRLRCSLIRQKMLTKYLPQWMAFIFGEEDKPP
jgi:hypothetical protein